ncbi:phytoene/squalene synthase family protein [Salinibaculum rarum]|uniref:phytoene/squalene synthase family protein n=1 Tax=Salinibaculum rarum TaxID=3058903 RepID=UPI00265EA13D|nr:phytoene/squalene synthase family protein [Salinibaculum sp. KK48]
MTMTDSGSVSHSDLDWCYDAVQDVSRTFALTISELHEPMSRYICVGYLLCRVADTIEDATHIPPEQKHDLLTEYHAVLEVEDETTPTDFCTTVDEWIPDDPSSDWEVVQHTPRVVETFRVLEPRVQEAMREPVLEMIDGMAMFVSRYASEGGLRIQTMTELEDYCWYVAGTVGSLVTNLLAPAISDEQYATLSENARSFALLLQLVNVAKDVRDDYREENNVFIPAEVLCQHDVALSDLSDPDAGETVAPAIETIVARAEQYVSDAEQWLTALPAGVQGTTVSAVAVPYLLAVATMRELKTRPEDVVRTGDVKVDQKEVFTLLARFHADETVSLRELRELIETQPLHKAD